MGPLTEYKDYLRKSNILFVFPSLPVLSETGLRRFFETQASLLHLWATGFWGARKQEGLDCFWTPCFSSPSLYPPPSLPFHLFKTNKNAGRLAKTALHCFLPLLKPPSSDMSPRRKAASKKRIKTALFKPWQAPAGLSALRHFGSASLSCWQSHWHQRHFSHTERPLSAPRLPTRPNHLVWTTDCLAGGLYTSHAPVCNNKQEVIWRVWIPK